jgi:hypothetical protein
VVAESVDTEEQLALLKKVGCDLVQGHYFAKPLPSKAIKGLLTNGAPDSLEKRRHASGELCSVIWPEETTILPFKARISSIPRRERCPGSSVG